MTIENKLNLMQATKENIKASIEKKGQLVGDIPFSSYPSKIDLIKTGIDVKDGIVYNDSTKTSADFYSSDGSVPDFTFNRTTEKTMANVEPIEVEFKSPITSIGKYSMSGILVKNPFFSVNDINSIGENALKYSRFPSEVFIVKQDMIASEFLSYTTFKSIKFDDSVTAIEDRCFEGLTLLEDIETLYLPSNLLRIGSYSFDGFNTPSGFNLKLPDSLIEIGNSPFSYSKVKNLEAGPNITIDAYREPEKYTNFAYMRSMLTAKVKTGGSYDRTFFGCSSMNYCEIGSVGNPVTKLSNSTFGDCDSLTKIVMYVSNPSSPPVGAPWGSSFANIEYRQA